MLTGAKLTLKRLFYDDSGVAIAYTVMASLFIFMLCVSVFAMSENIRQKIELQNACDAAAYSGAVVQADMLSRIAVLNRALSWTYLQANRMEMDWLIEDNWIPLVQTQHRTDSNTVQSSYVPGCGGHGYNKGTNFYASYVPGTSPYRILMRSYTEREDNVTSANVVTRTDITNANTNMTTIMAEIGTIRGSISVWISAAVNSAWTRSGMSADYTLFLNGESTAYDGRTTAPYFTNETNEGNFLAFIQATAGDMRNGVNVWWNLTNGSSGIQRSYVSGALSHSWTNYYQIWECDPYTGCKMAPVSWSGGGALNIQHTGQAVTATRLSPNFFGQQGSIIVAARRRLVNPFTAVMGASSADNGLYGAFSPGVQDMWTVSAARAGVKFKSAANGNYSVLWPGATVSDPNYLGGVWNLCEEDWDAVMLPVNRAWSNTTATGWTGAQNSTGILSSVRSVLSISTPWRGENVNNFVQH